MAAIVIQDACVLINLWASRRFEDIAIGCDFRFAIASGVAREVLYLRNPDSGEKEKIDLHSGVECGFLQILTLESDVEKARFIEMALDLDDGEAESMAIAETRGIALATDDRKARNIIARRGLTIELWSTCELLRRWQQKRAVSDAEIGAALREISRRAKYRPKFGHPDFDWWRNYLSQ
jgi:predicted nucleic acid-binding protein